MNELTECGSYLDGEKIFASESEEKAGTVQRWIPITEKLPNDNDDRFYTVSYTHLTLPTT